VNKAAPSTHTPLAPVVCPERTNRSCTQTKTNARFLAQLFLLRFLLTWYPTTFNSTFVTPIAIVVVAFIMNPKKPT